MLTYAGNLENLASVASDRHYSSFAATFAITSCYRPCCRTADSTPSCISPQNHMSIVVFCRRAEPSRPTARYSNPAGSARAAKIARFVHVRPTRFTAVWHAARGRRRISAESEQSVFSVESVGGPSGPILLRTFGLPVVITRASNNYGPYQFPEKLIPLMIRSPREQAAARLWRRNAGPRLAVRRRSLPRDSRSARTRARGRDLQYRRQLLADESGRHRARAGDGRRSRNADSDSGRPPRPRSAIRPSQRKDRT